MEFLVTLVSLMLCCAIGGLAQPYHHRAGFYQPAPIGHDGRVVDTPEVAQAKAAHLAAFSKLASRQAPHYTHGAAPDHHHYVAAAAAPAAAYGGHHHGGYSNPGYFSSRIQHGPYGYRGPPAPLAHDGRVLDTPEVAQAKAAHFAAFNHAASRSYDTPGAYNHQNAGDDYSDHSGTYHGDDDDGSGSSEGHYEAHETRAYQGPPAPLAQDGRVIDTPEVAHAKAAHLAAFHRAAKHHVPLAGHGPYYGDY